MLQDLHVSFQDLVRASRGSRLKGDPEELFSGAALPTRTPRCTLHRSAPVRLACAFHFLFT